MRFLSSLIFFAFAAFVTWPYVHVYQISSAVMNSDQAALEKLVDFESVSKIHKQNVEWKVNNTVDKNLLPDAMRGGAEAIAGALGSLAAETVTIDGKWIIDKLNIIINGSPWEQMTFAFFESPTSFVIRLGELGRGPIHIRMTMQDWDWRVTAIYV